MYIQWGDSALMEAAWRGMTGVVKELVEGGADLNLQDNVCQYECTKVHNPRCHVYARFTQKMSNYTSFNPIWPSTEGVLDLCNGGKTHKFFDLHCPLST